MPVFETTVTFRIDTLNKEADADEIADAFHDELENVGTFYVEPLEGEEDYECNPDVWGSIDIRLLEE